MQETWVRSLGWEDSLEKEMVTHSSILAWRIPWTKEPGGLQSTGSQRVGNDCVTLLHFMVTAKRPRVDFLSSTGLHEELELWYKQWPLAPICLLGECRRIWVSLSWFSNLPYWLKFWVLFGAGADYLPSPSRKDTGGAWGVRLNIRDMPIHDLDNKWGSVERYGEIPTQSKDTGWGAGWKMPGELPTQWKGVG